MGRIGQYGLLAIGIAFTSAGIGMAATGAEGGWPALLFFGLVAAVAAGQLWPDLLRREHPAPRDLLRRFPGPLELANDRRRPALLAAGAAILGGVPAAMVLSGAVDGWLAALLGLCAAPFCLAAVLLAALAGRGGTLRLTREGFERRPGRAHGLTPWAATGEFALTSVGPTRTGTIVYRDERAGGDPQRPNAALTGRSAALCGAYGVPPLELVQLLNAWRERALSGR